MNIILVESGYGNSDVTTAHVGRRAGGHDRYDDEKKKNRADNYR